MAVRKPQSVVEEPITSFDQITPEFLAEKERNWEEVRLKELTLDSLDKFGKHYAKVKREYELTENECKIKTMRAINLGYDKKELAEALGIPVRTINKWIRETQK